MNYILISLSIILLAAGLAKLFGLKILKKEFKHWNLPDASLYLVGGMEVVTAILLHFQQTEFASLMAATFIMTGAIVVLIISSEYLRTIVPLALLGLAGYLMWTNYPDATLTFATFAISGLLLLLSLILWAVPATKYNKEGDVERLDETTTVIHHFREVLGVKYHYVVAGNRNNLPVVIVPGLPETWYAWKDQIIALSKDYYVIALDTKPFGQTGNDLDGDHSYAQISNEIKALLDELSIHQFNLMGHDRGAVSCDHLLTKEGLSERVNKYVRMQQSFNEPHGEPVPPHHIMGTFLGTMVYKMRFSIPLMYGSNYVKIRLPKKEVKRISKEFHFEKLAQAIPLSFKTTNFGNELKDRHNWIFQYMTMPILILQGKHDPGQHPEEYYNSHTICPDLRVEFIDAGHFFHGEVPEITNKAILNFFAE